MPPTVRTPWFPAGCVLGVVVCVVLVGPAAGGLPPELVFPPELAGAPGLVFPPRLVFPPELAGAPELVFPPELVFTAEALCPPPGVAPLLATCAPDALPLLGGVGVPDAAPLLGVPVPELLAGEAVYACPATAAVAGCNVVVPPRCAKSYAIAPPRARVAMTFSVMNTIATRSLMGPFSFGRDLGAWRSCRPSPMGISCCVLRKTVGRS
jgi:hypothetical protein